MSGERKRHKQCQEMGLKKEESDKEIRREKRGERSEADLLAKGECWTLAGTTSRHKSAFSDTSLLQDTPGNASHIALPSAFII